MEEYLTLDLLTAATDGRLISSTPCRHGGDQTLELSRRH
jgi:hypothetical protein